MAFVVYGSTPRRAWPHNSAPRRAWPGGILGALRKFTARAAAFARIAKDAVFAFAGRARA